MTTEKRLERELTNRCRVLGALCLKFTSPSFSGVPDRMILKNGRTCFVELKSEGQSLRPRQKAVQSLFQDKGFEVFVVSDNIQLMQVLDYVRQM